MICNICINDRKTTNCFHGCSCNICDDCIIKWTKISNVVKFCCPFCKRESVFNFDYLSEKPFDVYCKVNSLLLLKKYSEKYKPDFSSTLRFALPDDEEIILLQPRQLTTVGSIDQSGNIHSSPAPFNQPLGGTLNPLFEPLPYISGQETDISFTEEENNFIINHLDY